MKIADIENAASALETIDELAELFSASALEAADEMAETFATVCQPCAQAHNNYNYTACDNGPEVTAAAHYSAMLAYARDIGPAAFVEVVDQWEAVEERCDSCQQVAPLTYKAMRH